MNHNKKSLTPQLRFPEFNNSSWEIVSLDTLADKVSERNKNERISRVFTNSATEGVVDQSEYFDRAIANENNLAHYFIVKLKDYVYNPRISTVAPVGPISRNNRGEGIVSPLYTVFRFRNKDNDFYEHFFLTKLWHPYMKSIANTGARHDRMAISVNAFMKMPVPYISQQEQQKIADCLASLDELISAENKKLDALKKHKQALMQNLFPAQGKTMPAWRFAQFQNDGEWEKEQLKDVCSYFSSSLTTNDITKDGLYDLYDANKLIGKTATYASDKEYIAIIKDGSGVGRIRLMKGYTNVVGTMGILTNKPVVDIQYLYYLLQTINFPIYKIGGAIPHIYFKDYSQATIFRPEKNEQEKIAECLSTADQLIQDQAHKLETLKMHKKALMQGLFPTLEDIK